MNAVELARAVEERGLALVPESASSSWLSALDSAWTDANAGSGAGRRGVLDLPAVAGWARSKALADLVRPVLGADFFVARGLFFDKTPRFNWKVPFHQDLAVALRARREVEGWSSWSVKEGVPHAHAPVALLEEMVTVRLHLDPCDAGNGALRVVPGSHRGGKIASDAVEWERATNQAQVVAAPVGAALVMRPLLWHASSPSRSLAPRRVVHLECVGGAWRALPGGLQWRWSLESAA